MSETLWIKLTAAAATGAPLPWARLDATGRVCARGCDRVDRLPVGLPRQAVVAAEQVLWTRLTLPGGRALRGPALAYALEERLVDEPEAVHAVAARAGPDGRAAVAVTARDWFAAALAAVRPVRVLVEPALLPASAEEWHLVWTEAPFLVTGEGAVQLSLDEAEALDLGRLALSHAPLRPARLIVHGGPDRSPPLPEQWRDSLGIAVEAGAIFDWAAAAQASTGQGLNLLQGEFGQGPRWRLDSRAWRPVIGLAVALLLINALGWLAGVGLDVWQAERLRASSRAVFVATFPATRLVDPALQMRRLVAERRHAAGAATASDFLPLWARAGEVLPAGTRAAVREVRFENGRLILLLPAAAATPRWEDAGLRAGQRPAEAGWVEWNLETRP